MAVAFRSAGTWGFTANNVQNPSTVTPGAPAGKASGDLLVLVCESSSITATVATPSGWTLHHDFPKRSGTALGGTIYVFLRIADGTATDTPSPVWSGLTTGTSGNASGAGILAYTGGSISVDGSAQVSDLGSQTTTTVIPASTTSVANSVVIGIAMKKTELSGQTSTVATFTERADNQTTSGLGYTIEICDKITTTPGSSGTATVTWSNSTNARALAVSFGLQQMQPVITPANIAATSTCGGSVVRKAQIAPATINAISTVSCGGSGGAASISTFYLHDAVSDDMGTLPSATVSPLEAAFPATGSGSNKSLDENVGTSQVTLLTPCTTTTHSIVERWLSAPLAAQTISAGTWVLDFAGKRSIGGVINLTMFVGAWRPSTGALVGTIFDTDGVGEPTAVNVQISETVFTMTVTSGGALTVQDGDVLVIEIFGSNITSNSTLSFYYDGTTDPSTSSEATNLVPPVAISMLQTPGLIVIPGGGGGTPAITPATISAASTVSGTVRRLRPIAPAQISATSTVSGNVTATKLIKPQTISATSSLSGAVSRLKPIVPASISATSTLSGNVAATKRITGASVAATSTVSGRVNALKKIAGAVAATSTVNGAVTAVHKIAGVISATSTLSGALRVTRAIRSANISATSTMSGLVAAIRKLTTAQVSATSTVSGAVTKIAAGKFITPTTNITATSTVAGSVSKTVRIAGVVSATSSVSGALGVIRHALGTVAATSTVSGKVSATHKIAGSVAATSTVSGSLRVTRAIKPAQISAFSTFSGIVTRLGTDPIIATTISATSTVSGRVIAIHKISGTISATSTTSGSIHVIRAVKPASVLATSTVTGSVRRIRHFTGQIAASSTVAGSIRYKRAVSGTVVATSTMSGTLQTKRGIAASIISSTSTVSGSVIDFSPPTAFRGFTPRILGTVSDIPIVERVRT